MSVEVEGQERPLRAWDLVHCPPWTEHVIVGAGDGPCAVLAVGARGRGGVLYPAAEFARRHGAAAARETDSPREARSESLVTLASGLTPPLGSPS
ncbi:MAG TPA: hypothetical protein VFN55_13550 [Solirubrobacteraceae bacterium]|nr:hypothetical protein [Solirubrobacteraceae bacterium]